MVGPSTVPPTGAWAAVDSSITVFKSVRYSTSCLIFNSYNSLAHWEHHYPPASHI